jgi:hypothetical protein
MILPAISEERYAVEQGRVPGPLAVGLQCQTAVAECTEGSVKGPRTKAGLEQSRRAKWKHGQYSAEAQAERRLLRDFLRDTLSLLSNVNRN